MAKKDFNDNSGVSFDISEEKLDLPNSIIPDLSCLEAQSSYAELQEKDTLSIADLLRLIRHLAEDNSEHQADCPFHKEGALAASRQLFNDKMS